MDVDKNASVVNFKGMQRETEDAYRLMVSHVPERKRLG